MMTGQAATASVANGTNSDDIWKFLAKGDFTVDAATKAQAQKDTRAAALKPIFS